MKFRNRLFSLAGAAALVVACSQEPIVPQPATPVVPEVPTPTAGSANFSKFIAVGNSLTAGFQAGALFTEGQNNSLGAILAKQFQAVGGGAFNQPSINSVNGCSNLTAGCTRGRLVLFDPDGPGPLSAAPTPAGTPGVPAPFNTSDGPAAFDGDKTALNNFGVPGVKLIEAVGVPNYGTLNPYYGRFASNPSGKTLLQDAAEKNGTFVLMFLGSNDVLKYATRGAIDNPSGTGENDMTPVANFTAAFSTGLTSILGTTAKGVVGNIPSISTIPFFTTVAWNAITLDATNAAALTSQLATNYNGFLNAMVQASVITAAERDRRLLSFAAGPNGVLITDETLTDLTSAMVANGASALVPFARARQMTSQDLVCLTAGSYLGRPIDITGDGTPDGTNGVSIPLANSTNATTQSLKGDDLVLTSTEIAIISERIAAFNAAISAAVNAANTTTQRVALADVNAAFAKLVTDRVQVFNGVTITPSFAPPTGGFSEDGVHPNSRGYAYLANVFIDAINAKFGATVPRASLADYKGTALPLNP